MPTKGSGPQVLVHTSVAVALVVADHEHHLATIGAIGDRRLGLAGHAAFETFSVLTRLPPPARRPPDVVARLLADNFPQNRFLSPDRAAVLIEAGEVVGMVSLSDLAKVLRMVYREDKYIQYFADVVQAR